MKRLRRWLQALAIVTAPWLGGWLMRLLGLSARVEIRGFEAAVGKGRRAVPSAIYAFWHDQLLNMSAFAATRFKHVAILVSHHRDGEIIARVVKALGLDVIRGSSTRGGAKAIAELAEYLRSGGSVVFTPDGPRGPRHKASEGVILLAQRLNKPVVPVACVALPVWRAGSWDRLAVPLPFARVVGIEGEPISIPRDADRARREQLRMKLEKALENLTERLETELAGGRRN